MSFYHTTTAANAAEVVTKIKDFAVAKGWSAWQDFDLGNRWVIQGSGEPIEIWSNNDYVYTRGVYQGTPNVSAYHNSYMRLYGHTVTEMHMMAYDSPDVMHFVFKFSNGTYRQGSIGEIEKIGVWTGGTMHCLTNHADEGNGYADTWPSGRGGNNRLFGGYEPRGGLFCSNGEANDWRPFYRGGGANGSYSVAGNGDYYSYHYNSSNRRNYYDMTMRMWGYTDSTFNWSIHLVPFPFSVGRPDGLVSPAGYAPHIRATSSATLTANQVVNVGGDDWRFFPVLRRGTPANNKAGSYNYYYGYFMDTGMESPISV